MPIISEVGIIISSTTSSSIPKTEESIFLYCFGINSPDSSRSVLSSSVFRFSFNEASFASNLNNFSINLLSNLVKNLNVYPKKGAIREGSDADIIIWDPSAEKTIKSETQQSVIDYNVFEGINVKGLPRFTLSRGRVAAQEGKVLASPGDGDFVSREPFSEVNKSLSKWKELTSPRKVERKAENMQAGV